MTTAVERTRADAVRQAVEGHSTALVQAILEFLDSTRKDDAASVLAAEQDLRTAGHAAIVEGIRRAIEQAEWDQRDVLRARGHACPAGTICHGTLKSKGHKHTTLLTLFGTVRVKQWIALCRVCSRLLGSVDELFNAVEGMTPACANAVALTGVTLPYEQSRKALLVGSGLDVDDNRVKRTVDAMGPRAKTCLERVPRSRREGLPPKGTRVYVMLDGGRIRLRAEGGTWREPCIALVMWERPDGTFEKFGACHPTNKDEVLKVLDGWMERLTRGKDWEVVIVGDGADWIWQWARKYPLTVQILDYYHVKEHVWETAKVLYGEGTPQTTRWAEQILNQLWRGWPYKVVEILDRMKPRGCNLTEKESSIGSLANYIQNHAGLIRYAHHKNKGRFTGSGAIESACKQLFSMRLKGPGMFWSEEGAGNVMRLRTLYMTDQWSRLWACNLRMAA